MQPPDLTTELIRAVMHGGIQAFDSVPGFLAHVIKHRQWATRPARNGSPFASFEAFIIADHPEGCETTLDDVKAFCRKRPDVWESVVTAMTPGRKRGGDRRSDDFQGSNTTLKQGRGVAYTIKRLKRDRSDLAAKVAAGAMSVNAAAIEAGFRRKPEVGEQLDRLWGKASAADQAAFLRRHGLHRAIAAADDAAQPVQPEPIGEIHQSSPASE